MCSWTNRDVVDFVFFSIWRLCVFGQMLKTLLRGSLEISTCLLKIREPIINIDIMNDCVLKKSEFQLTLFLYIPSL